MEIPPSRYITPARIAVASEGRRMRYTSPASPAEWMTPRPITVPHEMPSGTEGVGGAAAGRAVSSAVGMPSPYLPTAR